VVVLVAVVIARRAGTAELNAVLVATCSSGVEASDAEQDLVGHLAVVGLDDPEPIEMLAEPRPDVFDLRSLREAHLVEDHHVGKPDLVELELQQQGIPGMRGGVANPGGLFITFYDPNLREELRQPYL
jgi:hypothetical protein